MTLRTLMRVRKVIILQETLRYYPNYQLKLVAPQLIDIVLLVYRQSLWQQPKYKAVSLIA